MYFNLEKKNCLFNHLNKFIICIKNVLTSSYISLTLFLTIEEAGDKKKEFLIPQYLLIKLISCL